MIQAILAIDPGENIGWALFPENGPAEPIFTGCHLRTGRDWQSGAEMSVRLFREALRHAVVRLGVVVVEAYMEYPQFFEDASVAAKTGNLIKLTMAAGAIWGALIELNISVQFVEIRQWKGQMNKEATHNRIRKRLPNLDPEIKDHALDAVGIGLFARGAF